jgi:hypothetical protein
MRPLRTVTGLVGAMLLAAAIASCSGPPPSPSPSPTSDTNSGTTPTREVIPLDVRMAGKIHCAMFPYGCVARVSVLPPDAEVTDAWRPPDTDPVWAPDYDDGVTSTDHLSATPAGNPPMLAPGKHLVVVSLLGSYDVASYDAAGNIATDLLARCSMPIDAVAGADRVSAVVTFVPGDSFAGTCAIRVEAP